MPITITAFERSPDGGKGLARDTRVRWALEEVDQPYEVRGVSFAAMKEPAHLALHPFGQIPTYEDGGLALFETGAIVLIGEIGGSAEERAAEYMRAFGKKPAVAFIAGRSAPPGKRMGHAGAIVSGNSGTAESKVAAFEAADIPVATAPSEIPALVKKALAGRR